MFHTVKNPGARGWLVSSRSAVWGPAAARSPAQSEHLALHAPSCVLKAHLGSLGLFQRCRSAVLADHVQSYILKYACLQRELCSASVNNVLARLNAPHNRIGGSCWIGVGEHRLVLCLCSGQHLHTRAFVLQSAVFKTLYCAVIFSPGGYYQRPPSFWCH